MRIPAESVLQRKRQFARSSQISEFRIFTPPNAAPAQGRPGRMPPLLGFPSPFPVALHVESRPNNPEKVTHHQMSIWFRQDRGFEWRSLQLSVVD